MYNQVPTSENGIPGNYERPPRYTTRKWVGPIAVICALQTLAIMALVTQLLTLSQESWKQGFPTEYCKLTYSF